LISAFRVLTTWGICYSLEAFPSALNMMGFVTVLPRSTPSPRASDVVESPASPVLALRQSPLSRQNRTQLLGGRVLYADAGAAILSGDRSQSHSGARLTRLAGPVKIPSLRIFVMRVVRLSPSFAAAPFGPPTTQLV